MIAQAVRDPYGYMLSALQLQKLYVDRNVAADKLASCSMRWSGCYGEVVVAQWLYYCNSVAANRTCQNFGGHRAVRSLLVVDY
jgi:hypothetical protein